MKKIVSVIFLSLLVMKIGGYFGLLLVQQTISKHEAKEKIIKNLPNESLVKLSFSTHEFEKIDWKEADKEFYYQGKLYDIVRSELRGKNHVIYCLSDEEETIVYHKILQLSETQNEELPAKNTTASLLNILLLKYTIPPVFQFTGPSIFTVKFKYNSHLSISYLSIPKSLTNPPPEV